MKNNKFANSPTSSKNSNNNNDNDKEESLIVKAKDVFTRVPTLWALFCEILACQGLSTVLNVCCVTKVAEVIPDDAARADWMGKVCYSCCIISRISLVPFQLFPWILTQTSS